MIDTLSYILLIAGAGVVLIGAFGLLRLPDFFCRLHAAGVIDTLGCWLVMGGLLLQVETVVVGVKLLLLVVLLALLSPINSHMLARAARRRAK